MYKDSNKLQMKAFKFSYFKDGIIRIYMYVICMLVVNCNAIDLIAQNCDQEHQFEEWLADYKMALVGKPSSPLLLEDIPEVKFYDYNLEFSFLATVQLLPKIEPILFLTSSTKVKTFDKYAVLTFRDKHTTYKLTAYVSGGDTTSLFIPFKDATNGSTTYEGGRYLDIKLSDINEGTVCLDFNKAYNPYCAFASGYSCPKPPEENYLNIEINAGALKYLGVIRSKPVN